MAGFKSYSLREGNIKKDWYVVDASSATVGRIASTVAMILMGKHKPCYTPHMDCGDNVVVINAKDSKFSGKKLSRKRYYWHTGYPGGIKESTPERWLKDEKRCDRVLERAISGMMGNNPLSRRRLKHLHIYPGPDHLHEGQQPKPISVTSGGCKSVLCIV